METTKPLEMPSAIPQAVRKVGRQAGILLNCALSLFQSLPLASCLVTRILTRSHVSYTGSQGNRTA